MLTHIPHHINKNSTLPLGRALGSAGAQAPCWGAGLSLALHWLSLCGSSAYFARC